VLEHAAPRVRNISIQIQLPRDAEAIIDPGEFAAEAVIAERHERSSAVQKCRREFLNLIFGFALDE
jgi:hypothetical protein